MKTLYIIYIICIDLLYCIATQCFLYVTVSSVNSLYHCCVLYTPLCTVYRQYLLTATSSVSLSSISPCVLLLPPFMYPLHIARAMVGRQLIIGRRHVPTNASILVIFYEEFLSSLVHAHTLVFVNIRSNLLSSP